jgi:hypothetical protein
MVLDSYRPFLVVRDTLGGSPCSSVEGSSPRELWAGKKESAFVREDIPTVVVTVQVMHVNGEETPSRYLKCLEFGVWRRFLHGAHGPFNNRWSRPSSEARRPPGLA